MLMSYRMKMLLFFSASTIAVCISTYLFLMLNTGTMFGWLYSIAFALSALPQAQLSIKQGHSKGVADGTLILWSAGEYGGIIYGISLMQWPIIFNCVMNMILVAIIVWHRLYPRNS